MRKQGNQSYKMGLVSGYGDKSIELILDDYEIYRLISQRSIWKVTKEFQKVLKNPAIFCLAGLGPNKFSGPIKFNRGKTSCSSQSLPKSWLMNQLRPCR